MIKNILVVLLCLSAWLGAEGQVLDKLRQVPGVSDVKELKVNSFEEYYQFFYEQPVNHDVPGGAKFKQKVLLGHKREKAPVIVELQGYQITTPEAGELSALLKGNQLMIEHRFFGESVPEGGIPWEYLTIKQAAADQHEIIQAIRTALYPESKWITTGISKGGQTTIFHRYFYPEDVEISVPYVAPLNLAYIDPRIEKFLSKAGSNKSGFGSLLFGNGDTQKDYFWIVRDFQLLCFKNKEQLLPYLREEAEEKGYTFDKVGGIERAFELMVLEYQFAFWQWGHASGNVPEEGDGIDMIFEHLIQVSAPSFFEDKHIRELQPFFYAAMTEIGLYDYKVKPFKKYLKDKENITFDFTWPEGVERKPFNARQMEDINHWLQTDASKILFIYGGMDPWSATGVDLKANDKCGKYVRGDMHHGCRIKHFEEITKQNILETLTDWMK